MGDVCSLSGGDIQTGPFGSQLHASDYVQSGIPSIMPVNIGDNRINAEGIARITPEDARRLERYTVRPGDIVYSRRGDVERRALIRDEEDGWLCGTGCLRVRFGDGFVDPLFASYYLGHPDVRAWIVRHAVGATMPNLNTSILSALPFVLPPISEQRAIAHILGTLDDKIDLNRRMNETLEEMARALFKSWFVDFDPVRAKAAGRQPAGMDAAMAALFPDRFEESELGEVPAGWMASSLGNIIELAYGKALKDDLRNPGSVPVFGSNGRIGWHNQALVRGPGIVVGRKGNPGTVTWASSGFFPIDTTFYVIPRGQGVSMYYLFHALAHLNLSSLGADSAVPGLNRNMAYMSKLLLPDARTLDAFDRHVVSLSECISANSEQNGILASIRNALLPRLLSGEIRVGEAEKLVGAEL
jgi:type I restriction enzyme, S subunit